MKIKSPRINLELRKILFLLFMVFFSFLTWFIVNKKSNNKSYSIFIEFESAHGIRKGTPVRLRGFNIGSVVDLTGQINSVLTIININTNLTIIPKNSLIETNQTGLLNDTVIDIFPLEIMSDMNNRHPNPLSSECLNSKILCHLSYLEGDRGLNYDDLVRATTRIAQRFDDPRFFNLFYVFLQNSIELSTNALSLLADFADFTSLFSNGFNKM